MEPVCGSMSGSNYCFLTCIQISQEAIARRNINNLRYADDIILMAESEKELKRLFMQVKEGSEKAGLKPNIQRLGVYLRASLECSQHLKN